MKSLLLLVIFLLCPTSFAEEVSISVKGKTLKGELSIVGKDKSQAALILAGSGPTDRDGNTQGAAGKNNSLKYLSDAINKEGITTLRVDKRGVGASSDAAVQESDLRFSTYVEDAKQWTKFLEEQGFSEIILIGHSEGALVATMAASSLAASSEAVTGLVCIAGAGRPAPVILREQLKPKLPKELYSQADEIISSLAKGEAVADCPPALNALFRDSVQPYLISWFQIDPAKSISEVRVPVLIIQGSTDIQVSIRDAKLLNAKAKAGNLVIVKGMNHVLKEVEGDLSAQMPSYLKSDLPLHKDLVPELVEFLKSIKTEKHAVE